MRSMRRIGPALLALVIPAGLQAATPEDDLAVVKRAVDERPREEALPERLAPAPAPERRTSKEPQWLRVRIEDKGKKRGRVSINLPLALVRALDDDTGLSAEWKDRSGQRLKLSEVLRALDNGQSLVEIEDQDAHIRVWVE